MDMPNADSCFPLIADLFCRQRSVTGKRRLAPLKLVVVQAPLWVMLGTQSTRGKVGALFMYAGNPNISLDIPHLALQAAPARARGLGGPPLVQLFEKGVVLFWSEFTAQRNPRRH